MLLKMEVIKLNKSLLLLLSLITHMDFQRMVIVNQLFQIKLEEQLLLKLEPQSIPLTQRVLSSLQEMILPLALSSKKKIALNTQVLNSSILEVQLQLAEFKDSDGKTKLGNLMLPNQEVVKEQLIQRLKQDHLKKKRKQLNQMHQLLELQQLKRKQLCENG